MEEVREVKNATVYYLEAERMQYVCVKGKPEKWYSINDTNTGDGDENISVTEISGNAPNTTNHKHADFSFILDLIQPNRMMAIAARNKMEEEIDKDDSVLIRNVVFTLTAKIDEATAKKFTEISGAEIEKKGFKREKVRHPTSIAQSTITSLDSDDKFMVNFTAPEFTISFSSFGHENSTPEKVEAFLKKQHENFTKFCADFEIKDKFIFEASANWKQEYPLKNEEKKKKQLQLARKIQTELNSTAPTVESKNGIAAGSNLTGNPPANGYSLHYWMNQHREEINKKLNPDYSLPEKKYDLETKDGHTLTIKDNGEMAANLKSLDSMSESEFADFICKDLKAYVNMFKAMHENRGEVVFPPNKINLFVIKKEINTPEGQAKIERIEKLVAKQMHEFLQGSEYKAIKDKFTILGRAVDLGPAPDAKPAPAPKPTPSAPPLSDLDEHTPPDSDPRKLNLSKAAPDAAAPTDAPAAPPPPAGGSKPASPRKK